MVVVLGNVVMQVKMLYRQGHDFELALVLQTNSTEPMMTICLKESGV